MQWLFAALIVLALSAAKPVGDAGRGAYIARLGDCAACHTRPGDRDFAGGYSLSSPFGVIYSTNITPDKTYGIGDYTLQDFSRALREGIDKDGGHLYPAMPYPSYARMTDQDMADLYAYFMTKVPPVAAKPPETKLPFPFNQRWGLSFWNLLFRPDGVFRPDPARDAKWNRGAYLVKSLAHCGACHTPRNLVFAEEGYDERSKNFLAGGVIESQFAPELRQDTASGLGRWSESDIASFLKTGHARGVDAFANMKEFVEDSGQYISDEDLAAIAHYLKSLPAAKKDTAYAAPADMATEMREILAGDHQRPGAGIYLSACASCHGQGGEGKGDLIPKLAGNPAVLSVNPESLIYIVLEGATTPKTKQDSATKSMPGFSGRLTDAQVADVLSFIRTSWGNHAPRVSTRAVTLTTHAVKKDPKTKMGRGAK